MASSWNIQEIYAARRKRLLSKIDRGIAWINSGGASFDSGHCRNVEYLTGVRSPSACLVLAPHGILVEGIAHPGHLWCTDEGAEYGRGRRVTEALFVEQPHDRFHGTVVQRPLPSLEQVRAQTGMQAVYDLALMDEVLREALMNEEILWTNTSKIPDLDKAVPPDVQRINAIKEHYYWLQVKNIANQIHEMRLVKDAYEIECLRRAYQITKEVIETLMRTLKPGDNEARAVGIFQQEVKSRIDEGENADIAIAFGPIVTSGKRASTNNHWDSNRTMLDGELVLIDCGVSYNGYSSDISRAWPINGKFTARQREVYSIVYEGQQRGLEAFKPGGTCAQARAIVYEYYQTHGLARFGLGRNCHPVGLNTEDAYYFGYGDYPAFKPNEVWAFEPMLMMPEESMGIRLEDGVLITEIGHELFPAPASDSDSVEALCRGEEPR
ncbi:MAG TPA: M24 family metallopeptidase [Anaerolineae bacterium]|nr:M24 family metallopeptidase [Anaerolineae bacterium]